ncbi:hypothetical protein DYB36_012101 [Aphanomyces astaci]|uniref:Uncharacterized protein n=1 Tax=Aphanomyces astaci TaxID=112090 RepID=A0A397AWY4_APHAT|nr:hypothetical protein DYB36_012101 [Aphanomyces astaci]
MHMWPSYDAEHCLEGLACSLDSIGFKAFDEATRQVKGVSVPFSIMRSLSLVRGHQGAGLDLTLTGFGKSAVYHGDNEYCLLRDMDDALRGDHADDNRPEEPIQETLLAFEHKKLQQ